MTEFLFACRRCGRRAFLIRALCGRCAPEPHAEHRRLMEAVEVTRLEYLYLTGREPLDDWERFEGWMRGR